MIASEAYQAITDDVEGKMRHLISMHRAGSAAVMHSVHCMLTGLFQGWEVSGSALMGWGDELFVADRSRLKRLSLGEVL